MQRATRRAEAQVARLVSRVARSSAKGSARRLIATVGVATASEVIERYRQGQCASPEVAAWVTVVLRDLRVRDDAWARMLPENRKEHLRLWTDLTRLARPGYVAAPASLLAFVAWQAGNGALANVALDRALSDDPGYSMAVLLKQAIESGAPPSLARLPMTPEDVAASYDEMEAAGDDESGYDADYEVDHDGDPYVDDDPYVEDDQEGDWGQDDNEADDADQSNDLDDRSGGRATETPAIGDAASRDG
jgi:Domain of unknown function (DUF4192)